jgi:4-hydroxybenzoate polyprenyltransferase
MPTVSVGTRYLWILKAVCLCFLEARPIVQVIFLVRFLTGASFADSSDEDAESLLSLWFVALLWACATCSGYILNGVTDVKEDRINGSSRPIASGRLSVAQAVVVAVALGAFSLFASILVDWYMAWGVAAVLTMSWMYSAPPLRLKRWPAGLAVLAIAAALLTYYIGYTANGGEGLTPPLVLFALAMALWMGLVGQTKDLSDIEGDQKVDRKSLPVVWGDSRTRIAVSVIALAIGGAFLALALSLREIPVAPAVVVAVGAVAVTAAALGPWSRGDREKRRRPYRMFMYTQYGANLAVLATTGI